MSPDHRQELLAQARTEGVRFLAGMLGRDLPSEVTERLAHLEGQPDPGSSS